MKKMIITKYVVLILSPSGFEGIDWFMEVIGALSTNDNAVVGSLVASIDDVIWIIDGFVRDTAVKSIVRIIGELEAGGIAAGFNPTEGSIIVVGLSVGSILSIVESLLQVASRVVDISIGSSVIMF